MSMPLEFIVSRPYFKCCREGVSFRINIVVQVTSCLLISASVWFRVLNILSSRECTYDPNGPNCQSVYEVEKKITLENGQ